MYIADYTFRIRMVTVSTGIIDTIAGTGSGGYSGDGGVAEFATLYSPRGVAVDSAGRVRLSFSCFYSLSFFMI